ncbi:MAG TPA: 4-oxalocrotonate tautomerase family protein [Syntrophorhabdales bacterium]|nr:4-oxalocrotonate tautomerase family protein [Syntrophorhabdales bacterium]
MPYVNIKVTKEGVKAEQKALLIQGVTKLLKDVLGKDPKTVFVVIDEVDTDNWGVAGETITVVRKKQNPKKEAECAPQEPSECFPADLCNT